MRQRIWALLLLVFVVAGVHPKLASTAELRKNNKSPQFKKLVEASEKQLLAMFGLDSRPKPRRNQTLSDYMWHLYNNKQNELLRGSKSNTIRCFKGQEVGLKNSCDLFRVRHRFDLTSIPQNEHLWTAELVVYREKEPKTSSRAPVYRVQVYDVIRPATRNMDSILRLLDTRVIRGSGSSKWESFDVLPAVQRWLSEPHHNYGLHIHLVSSLKDSEPQSVRLKRSVGEDPEKWSRFEPLLVTYSRDPNPKEETAVSRTKRSTRKHRRKGRKDNCRRHALYVDFSDVGWNDWIIAPPGYNAYFCHGECPFPLPDHLNSTNHAIVQTLVNSANPAAVPRACCVPTELSPISMLYKDKYDNVVLKNYQDMVVEGCGCR